MSILDITSDNFEVTVADVSKEIKINSDYSYSGYRGRMSITEQRTHHKNAHHVNKILANRLIRNISKIAPGYPTGRQMRDAVEEVLGKKVSCRIQRYTGRDLKNMVSYHIAERGKPTSYSNYNPALYFETYKDTNAEIRVHRIDIIY